MIKDDQKQKSKKMINFVLAFFNEVAISQIFPQKVILQI